MARAGGKSEKVIVKYKLDSQVEHGRWVSSTAFDREMQLIVPSPMLNKGM